MFTTAELYELTILANRMTKSDKLENVLLLMYPTIMEYGLQIKTCLKYNKGHEIGICYLPGLMKESLNNSQFLHFQKETVRLMETHMNNLKRNYLDCVQILTTRPVNLQNTIRLVRSLLIESLKNIERSLKLNESHGLGLSHLSGLLTDTEDKSIYLQTIADKTRTVERCMRIMQGISVDCAQLADSTERLQ